MRDASQRGLVGAVHILIADDVSRVRTGPLDAEPIERLASPGDLDRWFLAAGFVSRRAVLVNTGWNRDWRTDQYFEGHPFLTKAAAEYLRDQGAALVGIDSLNIDDTSDRTRPVHSILLAKGIPTVEHLTNLSALPIDGFVFSAAPPKIVSMGTFPVRVHAIVNRQSGIGQPPAAGGRFG
jgi:kynurenine formamidase